MSPRRIGEAQVRGGAAAHLPAEDVLVERGRLVDVQGGNLDVREPAVSERVFAGCHRCSLFVAEFDGRPICAAATGVAGPWKMPLKISFHVARGWARKSIWLP